MESDIDGNAYPAGRLVQLPGALCVLIEELGLQRILHGHTKLDPILATMAYRTMCAIDWSVFPTDDAFFGYKYTQGYPLDLPEWHQEEVDTKNPGTHGRYRRFERVEVVWRSRQPSWHDVEAEVEAYDREMFGDLEFTEDGDVQVARVEEVADAGQSSVHFAGPAGPPSPSVHEPTPYVDESVRAIRGC